MYISNTDMQSHSRGQRSAGQGSKLDQGIVIIITTLSSS